LTFVYPEGLIKDLSSLKQLVLVLYWEFSILMKCRFMIYRVQRLTDCNAKISWILLWYVKFSLHKFWSISDFWALVVKVQNGLQQEKNTMTGSRENYFFKHFPLFQFMLKLDLEDLNPLELIVFICLNLYLHVTMIIFDKYNCISIVGSPFC
jgi:hypothetical protein